jgi:hypothetical protein
MLFRSFPEEICTRQQQTAINDAESIFSKIGILPIDEHFPFSHYA